MDGIDCAGKTTLASSLARVLTAGGLRVIQASVDDFHRPRAIRYRQGEESARGYFEDAFDYDALRSALLLPLGPGGSRRYRRAVFDHRTDMPVHAPEEIAPDDCVLIVDGVFLLRPELIDLWDFRIFVDVSFDVALRRAIERDRDLFGTAEVVKKRYHQRYFPAQCLYLDGARPRKKADIVVKNDDVKSPRCEQD